MTSVCCAGTASVASQHAESTVCVHAPKTPAQPAKPKTWSRIKATKVAGVKSSVQAEGSKTLRTRAASRGQQKSNLPAFCKVLFGDGGGNGDNGRRGGGDGGDGHNGGDGHRGDGNGSRKRLAIGVVWCVKEAFGQVGGDAAAGFEGMEQSLIDSCSAKMVEMMDAIMATPLARSICGGQRVRFTYPGAALRDDGDAGAGVTVHMPSEDARNLGPEGESAVDNSGGNTRWESTMTELLRQSEDSMPIKTAPQMAAERAVREAFPDYHELAQLQQIRPLGTEAGVVCMMGLVLVKGGGLGAMAALETLSAGSFIGIGVGLTLYAIAWQSLMDRPHLLRYTVAHLQRLLKAPPPARAEVQIEGAAGEEGEGEGLASPTWRAAPRSTRSATRKRPEEDVPLVSQELPKRQRRHDEERRRSQLTSYVRL